jgi:hypothetical protein
MVEQVAGASAFVSVIASVAVIIEVLSQFAHVAVSGQLRFGISLLRGSHDCGFLTHMHLLSIKTRLFPACSRFPNSQSGSNGRHLQRRQRQKVVEILDPSDHYFSSTLDPSVRSEFSPREPRYANPQDRIVPRAPQQGGGDQGLRQATRPGHISTGGRNKSRDTLGRYGPTI